MRGGVGGEEGDLEGGWREGTAARFFLRTTELVPGVSCPRQLQKRRAQGHHSPSRQLTPTRPHPHREQIGGRLLGPWPLRSKPLGSLAQRRAPGHCQSWERGQQGAHEGRGAAFPRESLLGRQYGPGRGGRELGLVAAAPPGGPLLRKFGDILSPRSGVVPAPPHPQPGVYGDGPLPATLPQNSKGQARAGLWPMPGPFIWGSSGGEI